MINHKACALLRSEAGNAMVSNIIGAVTMLVVSGAIATGIVALLTFQVTINDRTAVTKEVALVDSVFRSDVQWASTINPVDDHTVELTVPGRGGQCKVATWSISVRAGKTVVDTTVANFPGFDATVNPVRCSGTGTTATTQTLVADARPNSKFIYTNAGGRELIYSASVPALGGDPVAPAGVGSKAWAATAVASVTLDTEAATSTPRRSAHRITQAADNLSVIDQAADAPSHFVPEGNLTAPPAG